jgi:pimeloyl-ACP methyl ester carboxylesterase
MRKFLKWLGMGLLVAVVGLVAAYWTPDTDPAAMRAKYGTPPSQFVDLGGGLTVHLRDEGPRDAPAIVLLHGSNADLRAWDDWARDLSRDHRVIRFDQIGHGLTGPSPTRDYATAAFIADVNRVADKLGVKNFILGGSSMGGGIGWAYAAAHPERLRGLILVDPGGAPVETKERDQQPLGFRIARMPLLRDAALRITPRSLIERSLSQSVSNKAVVTDAAVDRYWELLRYPGNRQATLDRFSTQRPPTDEAQVRGIRTPTLILWGAEDKVLPATGARWFGDRIAGSQVIVYPGTGHLPMEEVPERSLADVRGWLAKLPAPR